MSTVQEIEAALGTLSPAELRQIARRVDELFRSAKGANLYDDAHGLLTDADLIVAADEAFRLYDREESKGNEGKSR